MNNQQKIIENDKFWDVKRAGERLLWRFGLDKPFKPNEDDKIALKSVLAWINRQSSGVIEKSPLFAKLYLLQMIGIIRENKTTVFNEAVFQELSNQLSKPLTLFYRAFYDDIVANQLNRLSEDSFKIEQFEDVVSNQELFKKTFTPDYVVKKLNEMMISTLHKRS